MQQQFKRRLLKYYPIFKLAIVAGLLLLGLFFIKKTVFPLYQFTKQNNITPEFIRSLIFSTDIPLKKYKNRTNIVLLGISGGDHEGSDLTDSILFLSLDWKTFDTILLSIPRDIWMKSLKAKINTAYHYGEEKKKGGGLILSKSAIEEIVGVPLHYVWLIDFNGFTKMIDLIGGVDIDVPEKIDDKKYPIKGLEDDFCAGDPTFACRYEHLVLEKGKQHIDGELALKYVRSRGTEGEQGTDFSRGKRQQQVILAFKDKIINMSLWKNQDLLRKMYLAFNDATDTDMKLSEQILFAKYFLNSKNLNIRHLTLDTGNPEKKEAGYLMNPPLWQYDGAWVLIPKSGDFGEIQRYLFCQLDSPNCPLKP